MPRADTTLTDLVRRWERGWRECRGWATPEEACGGLHILQHRPGRHREIVALHDDPSAVRALAEDAASAEQPTWLTVPTTHPDETERVVRDVGLRPRDAREWLMTRDLADHPAPAVPGGYRLTTTSDGPVVAVEVWHESGDLAANGLVAVVGDDTVPDRIGTRPDHRRRGLGTVVMGTLTTAAVDRGARHGILLASADGQALYTSLGWTTTACVVIATSTWSATPPLPARSSVVR